MSKINVIAGAVLALIASAGSGYGPMSAPAQPTINGNWTVNYVVDEFSLTSKSQFDSWHLTYERDKIKIRGQGDSQVYLPFIPPGSFLWRPNGNGLAVNNGDGSGQTNELSVFLSDNGPKLVSDVDNLLKSYFVMHSGCSVDLAGVNVYAEGWSLDGSSLWVRFELRDRREVCSGENVYFASVDVPRIRVTAHLSKTETMKMFCSDPGFVHQFRPNCEMFSLEAIQ
jgi:hypothetical protein